MTGPLTGYTTAFLTFSCALFLIGDLGVGDLHISKTRCVFRICSNRTWGNM